MKASERRAIRRDMNTRRCPQCRNTGLDWVYETLVTWCEVCGFTGQPGDYPVQSCYLPREIRNAD